MRTPDRMSGGYQTGCDPHTIEPLPGYAALSVAPPSPRSRDHGTPGFEIDSATAMTTPSTDTPRRPLTGKEWLICGVAALGFAFDIYELLMLPLIVRPALLKLVNVRPGTPEFNYWVGMLFYIPALAGGIFGLIGGYLTEIGRASCRERVWVR